MGLEMRAKEEATGGEGLAEWEGRKEPRPPTPSHLEKQGKTPFQARLLTEEEFQRT